MTEAILENKYPEVSILANAAAAQSKDVPGWMIDLRRVGLQQFEKLGFPSRKEEAWRLTDLSTVQTTEYKLAPAVPVDVAEAELVASRFAGLGGPRIVFANGALAPALSRLDELPAGVTVRSLRNSSGNEDAVRQRLNGPTNLREPFRALNLALLNDGAVVSIRRGTVVEAPIEIVFLNLGHQSQPTVISPRVIVVAESGSQARIVESHLGPSGASYLTNAVSELVAAENAGLDFCKLQVESPNAVHLGAVESHQSRNSSIRTTLLTLSGRLVRNDTKSILAGEGGGAELDGLYLISDNHHVDNYTQIEHAQPHCESRELYKGILADRATGVFRGRIVVAKGAQKTDSKQTNRNLLLSDKALINTKPQLEIYADDVKCTHGATIGQLDRDAIFYLRARGISLEAARSMLLYAFANEVVERIQAQTLREKLDQHLFEWLPMGEAVKEAF